MISKAVSVGAYESAVIIYRLDGKELCRKCTRCQKRDPRKRTQFNKHHGPGKCPVVASLPHMAPQDMDVDAAAAGHGEGGATLSYCSSNAARGLAGVSAAVGLAGGPGWLLAWLAGLACDRASAKILAPSSGGLLQHSCVVTQHLDRNCYGMLT